MNAVLQFGAGYRTTIITALGLGTLRAGLSGASK